MASDNFLGLVNRVLNAVNEVELTSVSFASTQGFYTEAKNAVNQGLFDVYAHENVEWPFLFNRLTFSTSRGIINYSKDSTTLQGSVDWNSFKILRGQATISSLTQTGGLATANTSTAHSFMTGDAIFIYGADQANYNSDNIVITVTSPTQFTYAIDSSTVSPATGSLITAKSNTVTPAYLFYTSINDYRKKYFEDVESATSEDWDQPYSVTPTKSEDFIIFPASDRTYVIEYEAFAMPSRLVNYNDTHLIPEQWEQAIVDMALYRVYMFRDNSDEAKFASDKGLALTRQMRKALMPVQQNVTTG